MLHIMVLLLQSFLSDSVEIPPEKPVLDYYASMDDDTITMVIGFSKQGQADAFHSSAKLASLDRMKHP